MENSIKLIKKVEIELPYDLAISLLGIYPKEYESVTTKTPAHPC
jgi:hypothetical protein